MLSRWLAAVAALVIPGLAGAQAPARWSGVYVGADAGGANARLKASGTDTIYQLTNVTAGPPGTPSNPLIVIPGTSRSFAGRDDQIAPLYGAFAGGQLQLGTFVIGVEGDLHGPRDAGNVSVTQTVPATRLAPPSTVIQMRDLRIRYDWSARARLGVATGGSLLYATGGIAQTRLRLIAQDSFFTPAGAAAPAIPPTPTFQSPTIGPVVITTTQHDRLTGWTAGLGGERRLGRHLSLGLDARYVDYGSHIIAINCPAQDSRTGRCTNSTFSSPPVIIYGRTHDTTDTDPMAEPGPTRISLTEWRLAARLIFRF
jgi:opacity protein-like surface antigen